MAKQEIYHESEKIYAERMNNLIENVRNSCIEAVKKAQKSYIKVKSLYDKGIISFYDEEKRLIFDENAVFLNKKEIVPSGKNIRNFTNNNNNFIYQSPIKNIMRRSPEFSSEVRYQSTEHKLNPKKLAIKPQFTTDLCVTFNEKTHESIQKTSFKEEIKDQNSSKEYKLTNKSSEFELNCRSLNLTEDFIESIGNSTNRSKGLVLKRSEEFSLKEKVRYSEEKNQKIV